MHGPVIQYKDYSVGMDSIPTMSADALHTFFEDCKLELYALNLIPYVVRSERVNNQIRELNWKMREVRARLTGQAKGHYVREVIRRVIPLRFDGECARCRKKILTGAQAYYYYQDKRTLCLACGGKAIV